MNLATLNEYIELSDEIETIAQRIVDIHAAADREERGPGANNISYYVDDISFMGISQGKVSIRVQMHGSYGWSDQKMIHVDVDDFCDPKYLIDTAE